MKTELICATKRISNRLRSKINQLLNKKIVRLLNKSNLFQKIRIKISKKNNYNKIESQWKRSNKVI